MTSLTAFFSATAVLSLLDDITLTMQVFASQNPLRNLFSPIPEVTVSTVLPGLIRIGNTATVYATGLNIPVAAQTRLLVVFSATSSLLVTLAGYVSGGIGIALT